MAPREASGLLAARPAAPLPVTGGRTRDSIAFRPRSFRWMWPRWQPPPGDGLVAIANQAVATLGWADALLARHGSDLYVWAAVDGEGVRYALEILDHPGVIAATLALNQTDPRGVNVALEVAVWLASRRAGNHAGVPLPSTCLTAWAAPTPPPGILRVPCLVTVLDGSAITDRVVWELLPAAVLRDRLGVRLVDLGIVESNLDVLIQFRGLLRAGRVPVTPVTARVLDLIALDEHRDLSIDLVIEHIDLFSVLFDAMAGRRPQRIDLRAPSGRAEVDATRVRRSA